MLALAVPFAIAPRLDAVDGLWRGRHCELSLVAAPDSNRLSGLAVLDEDVVLEVWGCVRDDGQLDLHLVPTSGLDTRAPLRVDASWAPQRLADGSRQLQPSRLLASPGSSLPRDGRLAAHLVELLGEPLVRG